MLIGILGGTGKEGSGLAMRLARAGHEVLIGSRDEARAAAKATELSQSSGGRVMGATNAEAAAASKVVIVAVPFEGHRALLEEIKPKLAPAKVVLDTVVPLDFKAKHLYAPPSEGSAAEQAQAILDTANVVAGLHQIAAHELSMLDHDIEADGLVCGDDVQAKDVVFEIVRALGVRPIDAGPLRNASLLESMTPLLIALNKRHKVKSAGIKITGL